MYLSRILDRNLGPIKNIDLICPFTENGQPKPIIIVGENGSGKSTLISNIVDALYELVGAVYDNVMSRSEDGKRNYYKAIIPTEICIGSAYMLSCAKFIPYDNSENNFFYIFKSGDIPQGEREFILSEFGQSLDYNKMKNHYKSIRFNRDALKNDVDTSVLCYFPPTRYERPLWLGSNYLINKSIEHINISNKYISDYDKPILIEDVNPITVQWLLDIIVDSRLEVTFDKEKNGFLPTITDYRPALISLQARSNIEKILSIILKQDVIFGLNPRSFYSARFFIRNKSTLSTIIPTISGLSSGNAALFTIFSTIVRYADYNSPKNSIELNEIKGIVIIDEIELHLHSDLQRVVLPQLIKLFPKIQFIITTHSPLFLLGMDEYFGDDGYEILQMPSGERITSELFSEFQKEYFHYSMTNMHRREIANAISQHNDKPLIITEGSTDWKHLKAAFRWLCENNNAENNYSQLDFDFLEYEPKTQGMSDEGVIRLEMGDSQLINCCRGSSVLPQKRKLIFIADADKKNVKDILSKNNSYKSWGNNVYSFVIPVPQHRAETPDICIEHYYTDDEIMTHKNISGIDRRLFLGNEFDERGISNTKMLVCNKRNSCGSKSIAIIDGSGQSEVSKIGDIDMKNIALPKMVFANAVLAKEENFCNFDFSAFKLIFNIIREILALPNE